MNIKRLFTYVTAGCMLIILSCGISKTDDVQVTGFVDTSAAVVHGPIIVLITNTDDVEQVQNDPVNSVISMINVAPGGRFNIDLASLGIKPDAVIHFIAFVDNDYSGSIPMPTPGDYIGYYIDPATLQTGYAASSKKNITIKVNRLVYDYSASIEGTVLGNDEGPVTLVAYAGPVASMNFSKLDLDNIMGYSRFNKSATPCYYRISIMPYGKNLPIQNVSIIGFIDKNENGIPDHGDKIGYYKGANNMPGAITINGGVVYDIDIEFLQVIPESSGIAISIEGNFNPPAGYSESSPPIFILVAKAENPQDVFENPIETIQSFQLVAAGANTFSIDLSSTGLAPGDKVMVIALWDKDYAGGFPSPTPGDVLGYYVNAKTLDFTPALAAGINTFSPVGDWKFDVNKTMYNFTASVQGQIQDDEAGNLVIVAYAGGLENLDPSNIDIDKVVGFAKVSKPAGNYNYTVSIMPFGYNVPIQDVLMMAFLDKNNSGMPDAGDRVGYYRAPDHMPLTISINAGETKGIDIQITKKIYNYISSMRHKLNSASHPSGLTSGKNLIAITVHEDGVNLNAGTFNPDYVLGMAHLSYNTVSNYIYNYDLYNFIDEDISIPGNLKVNVYVFMIYDSNGNHIPESGEELAAYWQWIFLIGNIPKTFSLTLNSTNTLSNPDNVRFIGRQIP